eukprot:5092281-Ditylum_brightwellii.AAC.1
MLVNKNQHPRTGTDDNSQSSSVDKDKTILTPVTRKLTPKNLNMSKGRTNMILKIQMKTSK